MLSGATRGPEARKGHASMVLMGESEDRDRFRSMSLQTLPNVKREYRKTLDFKRVTNRLDDIHVSLIPCPSYPLLERTVYCYMLNAVLPVPEASTAAVTNKSSSHVVTFSCPFIAAHNRAPITRIDMPSFSTSRTLW